MLFAKKAAKLAGKQPDTTTTTTTQQPLPTATIRWSDSVVTHTYESDNQVEKPKMCKIDVLQGTSRKCYSSESSAIQQERTRIKQVLAKHYQQLLPDLEVCKLYKKSVRDLEAIQCSLIDELDSLRCVDPESGLLFETAEFVATEDRLMLVLEALECISQHIHVEKLLQSGDEKNKRRREPVTEQGEQNRMCFMSLFRRHVDRS
jgi:hypothetical protein